MFKKNLITVTANFIGFYFANLLLNKVFKVHEYDGIVDYYDGQIRK